MRRWVVLGLCVLMGSGVAGQPRPLQPSRVVPGRVLVKFRAEARGRLKSTGALARVMGGLKGATLQPNFPTAVARATRSRSPVAGDLDLVYELRFDPATPVAEVVARLKADPAVKTAEPRRILQPALVPNDELINPEMGNPPAQWNLTRISAPQAWDISQGDTSVVIAVVDDGMQWWHYDLLPNLALNHADPIDGMDNDGNGYVDDYRGWDFVGRNRLNPVGDNDPQSADTMPWRSGPFFWHGTVVTSFAAAATNNLLGGASAGWKCRFLPIKVAPDTATADSFLFAPLYFPYEGVVYAADRGADIINCSWGDTDSSEIAHDVIRYATAQGALVVAAAGNSNSTMPFYPASYPEVLSVAMTNPTDVKVTASSFGAEVDVSAPGGGPAALPLPWGDYTRGGPIGLATSWASPQAAAVAALLKAHVPTLTPAELHARMKATTDNIDAQNPMFIGQLGTGRINAHKALVGVPTSVEDAAKEEQSGLKVYPNPTRGPVTVWLGRGSGRLEVVNALGALVAERAIEGGESVELTISSPGIYVVVLRRAGRVEIRKVVVQ